ncbi:type II toxin-antitoxin system RelE family toxin [Candidatus Nitrosotenuis sp. DW1]|uniref:type II toxin-antitoxin system RelE family toxin n=1 Tax=Candidatus Nitrosotenuis sp. DW1 TaxID=2259672 RepID=UPI0015CBFFDD|nr:type II toxin-antitoxin system RelE/ParE family toxin [Candidatus Nitrosotenuis sp. DW1]QLH08945.1 hypothetical protein DSQ19_05120 [Candidatus Nitrosotenuis sp. DW1]
MSLNSHGQHADDIKKLKGYDNHYRIRVGDYRILFFREDDIAKIYDVSHRSDVYK